MTSQCVPRCTAWLSAQLTWEFKCLQSLRRVYGCILFPPSSGFAGNLPPPNLFLYEEGRKGDGLQVP